MVNKKIRTWYFWPIGILLTTIIIITTLTIVYEWDFEEIDLKICEMILAMLFGIITLILIIKLPTISFLSNYWESISLSSIIAAIVTVSILSKSWGAGLGLGLIGVAIVVIRYIASYMKQKNDNDS